MYRCESWTIKKAEHQWIDAFELWFQRKLLRVPWTARRSKQSILKEINSEYSLEGLMLMLNFQYFGHLMWRADSLEKTLMLRKIEGKRDGVRSGWDGWDMRHQRWWEMRHHWLSRHEFEKTLEDSEGQGSLVCCSFWSFKELDMT